MSSAIKHAAQKSWDAIIVGGGHNGLVTAAYLAKAGKRVLVCERRHILGGAAVTEEIVPGFKFSRASYVYSLFRPQIVQDLNLKSHGLKVYPRDPSSFTPSRGDGPSLLLGSDTEKSCASIAQFSKNDAAKWVEYNQLLERLTTKFTPLLDNAPPDLSRIFATSADWRERFENFQSLSKFASTIASMKGDLPHFWEFLTAPAAKILDRWFEGDVLKATLATDSVIGAMTSPYNPQSGYVLLHHVMGELDGQKGMWGYVEGGMGSVSQSIASAARMAGAELLTESPVKQILVKPCQNQKHEYQVEGVELEDGSKIKTDKVFCGAAPQTLFNMLPEETVDASVRQHVLHADYMGCSTKINIALDKLPDFLAAPNDSNQTPQPHHRGTIHFEHSMDEIHSGYLDAAQGRVSERPIIEMTIPSVLDPTLAPPGKHVALLFVQYSPYFLEGGWTDAKKQQFVDSVFNTIEEFAPGFKSSIVGYDALTPPDLERIIGLPRGNIFHLSMGLDQLLWSRPMSGYARYTTPVEGVYLCGAGAHPGGGVMGAPGRNAAMLAMKHW